MSHQVFISYASQNTAESRAVLAALQAAGLECWWAPRDIEGGKVFAQALAEALIACRVVVVLLSPDANRSEWVLREVIFAIGRNKLLIPFRLADCSFSSAIQFCLGPVQWLDAYPPPLEPHLPKLIDSARDCLLRGSRNREPATLQKPVPLPWTAPDVAFVGRDAEMARLAEVWEKVRAGQSQAVLIKGDAGVGKTRILREFVARQATEGVTWLYTGLVEGDVNIPYCALAEAVRPMAEQGAIPPLRGEQLAEIARFVPEIGDCYQDLDMAQVALPDQAHATRRLAWAGLVRALTQRSPLILAVDDLQWADGATLNCLEYLLIRNPREPFLLVCTARTTSGRSPKRLAQFLQALWKARCLTEIGVDNLQADTSHRLVCARLQISGAPRFGQRLHEFADGNPFALLETIQLLVDTGVLYRDAQGAWSTDYDETTTGYMELPIPDSVREVMLQRLQGLDESSRTFLNAAAVLGRQFDPSLIQRITGMSDEQIEQVSEELAARGLIREEEGSSDFSHGLLRETIYREMQPRQRQRWHSRAGAALEAKAEGTPSSTAVGQLARHFTLARLWPQALKYNLQAGEQVLELFDCQAAQSYFHTAQHMIEAEIKGAPPECQIKCLEGLGDAARYTSEFDQALAYYRRALGLLAPQGQHAAALLWKIGMVLQYQGLFEQASAELNAGLAALESEPDAVLLSRLCIQHGIVCVRQERLAQALEWANRALAVDSAQAHNLLGTVHRERREFGLAHPHFEAAFEHATAAKNLVDLAKAQTNLGVSYCDLDRWEEAGRANQQAVLLATTIGDDYMHASVLCNKSDVDRLRGDLEAAMASSREALGIHQEIGAHFGVAQAQMNLGAALLESGQAQEARVKHLEVALGEMEEHDIGQFRAEVHRLIAGCYLAEGRPAEAESAAQQAADLAEQQRAPWEKACAERLLGNVAWQQGRSADAQAWLHKSIAALREYGPRYELGRALMDWARVCQVQPERQAERRAALEEAQTIFRGLGALRDLRLSEELAVV